MNIEITSSLKGIINDILSLPWGFNPPVSRNPFIGDENISREYLKSHINTKCIFRNDRLASSVIEELLWQAYYSNNTPNGSLIVDNSLFQALEKTGTFSCIHITSSLDGIIDSGEVRLSSGCLPYTIYATPYLHRVHNLTTSILAKELSHTLGKKYSTILFRFYNFKRTPNIEMSGFDSQLLGGLYYEIFQSIAASLPKEVIKLLEYYVYHQIASIAPFFSLCHDYEKVKEMDSGVFLDFFVSCIRQCGVLGGLYFEAIAEYIMLFQSDAESMRLKSFGELNNKNHKALIFELSPYLKKKFNVAFFYPALHDIVKFIQDHGFISCFDIDKFSDFLKYRLSHMVRYKITRGDIYTYKSTFGHLVYFFMKYEPSFRFYYQLFCFKKKEILKKQWNDKNVIFPYSGSMPKGEIGINPSIVDFEFDASVVGVNNNQITMGKRISVKFVDRLIEANWKNMTTK